MPQLVYATLPTKPPTFDIKLPQARVLSVLLPEHGDNPPVGTIPRAVLAAEAGFVPTSGTMSKVLRSKDGTGLLQTGLVDLVQLDLDGVTADAYRITRKGIQVMRDWLRHNELPPLKDATLCTNDRFKEQYGNNGIS